MGATSVTGKGVGAAEPNKGPNNGRNNYVSLLDPHVVFSGTVFMDTGGSPGQATVYLPENVKQVPERLTIVCGGKAYMVNKNLDGNGLVESFDIEGAKKIDIDFLVIDSVNENLTTNI
jgi:hypothetical protein